MVYFKVLPSHLSGVTEGNHDSSVRIICAVVEIQTGHLPNTSQYHYHLLASEGFISFLLNSWIFLLALCK
jgi:hypothetical protein